MKILFFIQRFPGYGGIETVTTILANYLVEQGHEVNIISLVQEVESLLDKLNDEVHLFRFPDKKDIHSVENEDFLYLIINKIRPDVLINQENYSRLFQLLPRIKAKIACKVITVEHNTPDAVYTLTTDYIKGEKLELKARSIIKKLALPYLFCRCYYMENKYHRMLYKYSDEYILLSDKFIPIFRKMTFLKALDKIKVIENPITVSSQSINLKAKEKIILYVGRLDYGHKRVDRLVKIWEGIYENALDWKLLIVGDGPDRDQLESYVKKRNIANIIFEGSQSNVERYYSRASILCLTSTVEGWPLVLAESMALGCVPVLYNSFASAPDIVTNRINGLLIEPFDDNSYSNALLELIENPDQRKRMADKAIEDSARFSLNKVGSKWQKLLNHLISN